MIREASIQMGDYWLARLAGRLDWSLTQVKEVGAEVASLCERLGWRSARGFARLQAVPHQTIRDWLVIADLEREKEQHNANR